VATRGWILLLLLAAVTGGFAGCGGGSTTNVQNPPPPTSSTVAIAFQPAPPTSVFLNGTLPVTAMVSNDPSNAGVDWSVTCQNTGNCGLLSPVHTPSGQAATYTPPSTLATNSQTVNIAAFATADHTKNVVAQITITAFASNLKGTYVLQTSGIDISGLPYQRSGVIVLDGNGGITSGEQTVNFVDPNTFLLSSASDPISGGSYFVGPDGRGTLTINTADVNIGQQGVETFSLVLLSSAQAFITKTDDPNIQASSAPESSVGTLDLQTSPTAPAGGYAFVVRGTDVNSSPLGFGGVLNVDSPKTISGAGSVFDIAFNDGSGTVNPSSSVSGTVSDPDSFGKVLINLTTDFAPIQLTGYLVDAAHIKLIESDNSAGAGFGATAGVAIGQGSATGTFTSNSSFSGKYVFGIFGQDLGFGPSSLASAGMFTADGKGNLTGGFLDEFQSGLFVQVSDRFHGTYTVDPAGSGRVDTNSSITFANPNNGTGPEFVFYLTGNGNPPLILDADVEPSLGGGGLGTGIAYPAVAGASFSGQYGLSFTQNFFGSEADGTGQMTVDTTAHTLSGIVDTNSSFFAQPNTPLTGSFQTTAISGRLTGTLSNELFPTDLAVAYYLIDSDHGFFVETDSLDIGGSLSFGYFARRSPVCQGCP
jgi:hypothetical protein